MSHDEVAVVAVRYSKLGEDEVLEDTTETEDEDSKVEILAESSIDECDADSGEFLMKSIVPRTFLIMEASSQPFK